MPPKNRPPKALRDGLSKLFEQHDWPGMPAGLIPSATGTTTAGTTAAGTGVCPPGTSPHDITYQDANGNWITKTVCL
jgi:hypothetical protein